MLRTIRNILKNSEFLVALIFLLIGGILLQQTVLITNEQSKIFPYVAVAMILISGIALMPGIFTKKTKSDSSVLKFNKREFIILALLVCTYFASNILGFYTSIYLFLVISYLCIEGTWSKAAVKTSLLFNTLLIIILYISFAVFLGMVTPIGLLI